MFLACSGWMRNHCYLRQPLCHVFTPTSHWDCKKPSTGREKPLSNSITMCNGGKYPVSIPSKYAIVLIAQLLCFVSSAHELVPLDEFEQWCQTPMKHEIEDRKYPASIYYNATPAEIHLTSLSPFSRMGRREEGFYTHTTAKPAFYPNGVLSLYAKKYLLCSKCDLPLEIKGKNSLVENFQPAQVPVPKPELSYPVWDR